MILLKNLNLFTNIFVLNKRSMCRLRNVFPVSDCGKEGDEKRGWKEITINLRRPPPSPPDIWFSYGVHRRYSSPWATSARYFRSSPFYSRVHALLDRESNFDVAAFLNTAVPHAKWIRVYLAPAFSRVLERRGVGEGRVGERCGG